MTRDPREALVAWRASTGYSQAEVGALFGVTKHCVQGWERGLWRVSARVQARLRAEGWLPPLKYNHPLRQHEPLCPVIQPCRSCTQRRRRADPAYQALPRFNTWLPEHEARLAQLAGTMPVPDLAAQLSAEFGVPRSPQVIYARASALQLSLVQHHYTRLRVAWLLGAKDCSVGRWLALGWLTSRQCRPGGHHTITAAALETFLRDYPGVVDWRRMPIAHGPERRWRDLVQQFWQRDPLYTTEAAARYLGCHRMSIARWCLTGKLRGWYVTAEGGQVWRIPRSALLAFERQRAAS